MQSFDPTQFGILMGQLVQEYRTAYRWLAPLPHLILLLNLLLIIKSGNRHRKFFTITFLINYIWLFIFVGIWFSVQLFQRQGPLSLAMYIATPFMLIAILIQWIRELKQPSLNLDPHQAPLWKWLLILPFLLWGFWYPPYIWGQGFLWNPSEFIFGAYGLMGCPSTLVVLALLFPNYPHTNRPLVHALTAYAVIIGLAMVALKYLPDIPFFLMGLISLAQIIIVNRKQKKSTI